MSKKIFKVLTHLWSLPYGVLGLLALLALHAAGLLLERRSWIRFCDYQSPGWIVCVRGPLARKMYGPKDASFRWKGFTLGWVCFFWDPYDLGLDKTIVNHELAHVRQCLIFGPLFPVLYLACFVYGLVRYRDSRKAYNENWFERWAREDAGQGQEAING